MTAVTVASLGRSPSCPLCGGGLTWQMYDQMPGATAGAICETQEVAAYGWLKAGAAVCPWKGRVQRDADGGVSVVVERAP